MNRLSLFLLILLLCSLSLNYVQFQQSRQTTHNASTQPSGNDITSAGQSNAQNQSFSSEEQPVNASVTQSGITADKKDQAQLLFDQGKYYDAIALYTELLNENEIAARQLLQAWWEIMKTRLANDDLNNIWPFVNAFLDNYPFDAQMLAIKAEAFVKLERIEQAIDVYYDLHSNSYEQKQQEYFEARIRHLAREKIKQLTAQLSWQALIDFVEQMLIQEPGFPPYLLAQAEAMIHLEQSNSAEEILEPLLDNSYYRQSAQQLLSQIDKARLQRTAIRLQPRGEHYLVQGIVDRANRVNLMIDTGASLSVLTDTVFNQLEGWSAPEYVRDTLLNTAGGQINAPIYRFERFQIGDFFVDNMQFVVIPIEGMNDYDGLLGMNFLKHFKFEIDQQDNLLILSP